MRLILLHYNFTSRCPCFTLINSLKRWWKPFHMSCHKVRSFGGCAIVAIVAIAHCTLCNCYTVDTFRKPLQHFTSEGSVLRDLGTLKSHSDWSAQETGKPCLHIWQRRRRLLLTWERSVERNSKTKVREVLVWMMSCRVTMFAWRKSFNRLAWAGDHNEEHGELRGWRGWRGWNNGSRRARRRRPTQNSKDKKRTRLALLTDCKGS